MINYQLLIVDLKRKNSRVFLYDKEVIFILNFFIGMPHKFLSLSIQYSLDKKSKRYNC